MVKAAIVMAMGMRMIIKIVKAAIAMAMGISMVIKSPMAMSIIMVIKIPTAIKAAIVMASTSMSIKIRIAMAVTE